MWYHFTIFVVTTFCVTCHASILPKAGCSISVNEHFTDPQVLLLLQNDATTHIDAFPSPVDDDGTLEFKKGETLDLACPGGAVVVDGKNSKSVVLEAQCSSGINFVVDGETVPFTDIKCSKVPSHTARYTGNSCAGDSKEIEIGFLIEGRFISHITTCFDTNLQHVLYAESTVSSAIAGNQVNYPRPGFQVGSFYNVKPDSVSTLYTQNGQRKTVNGILGLSNSDPSIIKPSSTFYLATGHYTPKADFVYGAQQRLTFYYVNAAPQWQCINAGNWNTMEANYRSLASNRGFDLVVYTGGHGVTTLPDVNNNDQELYLWVSGSKRGIPVPAFYYKVLYEPNSKAGIALVAVNNPYNKITKSDVICTDVCDKVDWLTWKRDNVTLGYAYCCEVDDFRSAVKALPAFEVSKLLV